MNFSCFWPICGQISVVRLECNQTSNDQMCTCCSPITVIQQHIFALPIVCDGVKGLDNVVGVFFSHVFDAKIVDNEHKYDVGCDIFFTVKPCRELGGSRVLIGACVDSHS